MTLALEEHRQIHFVGVGGIGMSALARFLMAQGFAVTGSDREAGEQTLALQDQGAIVYIGHRAENVNGADLVVATSAAPRDNPELEWAAGNGIPVIKRSQLLAAIMNPRRGIAVAGTHGKTTTSALIGHILTESGLDPTILVGGVSANLGSNARVGGDLVVVEADEYDASFLRLEPAIAVITNVEADHLDFYGTEEAVRDAFRAFARQVSDLLVVCADDSAALAAAEATAAMILTYGLEHGDWRACDMREEGACMRFTARYDGRSRVYETTLAGEHSVRNALAAIAVAHALGVPDEEIARALASFRGVARRLETVGEVGGVLVLDDYAHHPSEIRTDLRALRERYHRPIRVIFQPHTYSRTKSFLLDFAQAFGDAAALYLLDIYAAREVDTQGITGEDLAREARLHHRGVAYPRDAEEALRCVVHDARPGDLVVTMGAGDVTRLAPRILLGLEQR